MIPAVARPAGWYESPTEDLPYGNCPCDPCEICGGKKRPHKAWDERDNQFECFGFEDDIECEGHDE